MLIPKEQNLFNKLGKSAVSGKISMLMPTMVMCKVVTLSWADSCFEKIALKHGFTLASMSAGFNVHYNRIQQLEYGLLNTSLQYSSRDTSKLNIYV